MDPSTHTETVLVVEDDPDAQQVALSMLSMLGYATRLAGNGREALAILGEFRPSVILLDLHMPELDGLAFLDTARREVPGFDELRVIATSGVYRNQSSISRPLRNRGVRHFVGKPFSVLRLRAAMEGALADEPGLDPFLEPPREAAPAAAPAPPQAGGGLVRPPSAGRTEETSRPGVRSTRATRSGVRILSQAQVDALQGPPPPRVDAGRRPGAPDRPPPPAPSPPSPPPRAAPPAPPPRAASPPPAEAPRPGSEHGQEAVFACYHGAAIFFGRAVESAAIVEVSARGIRLEANQTRLAPGSEVEIRAHVDMPRKADGLLDLRAVGSVQWVEPTGARTHVGLRLLSVDPRDGYARLLASLQAREAAAAARRP